MSDAPPPAEPVGPLTADGQPVNRKSIFLASFMTLIAAGIGFAVRGIILPYWADDFGFTFLELGTITGGGLVGFGVVILGASLITDRLGYKTILVAALVLHVLSAVITLAAAGVYASSGKDATFQCLYWGTFLFAIGNGLCEAVINPLVATLYPRQKTHYLNILHAGWPGGLILGSLICLIYQKTGLDQTWGWEWPMGVFLIPVAIYGLLVLKDKFPVSEAVAAGVSYGEQFAKLFAPLMLFLLLLQACVGYVELGTDSWIASITEKIAEGQGTLLFIYASTLMFVLRFFAGPIVEKINPIGLLFVSACLGAVGLYFIGSSSSVAMVWIAMTVYGLGKTFLWPTMLGVVGETFPRGGAITMGAVGGVGMLSAGLLGGPGIGYKQDFYATQYLKDNAAATYDRVAVPAEAADGFLFFPEVQGIDGAKKGVILDADGPGVTLSKTAAVYEERGEENPQADLVTWFDSAEAKAAEDKGPLAAADEYGGRMALKLTALVPTFMAVCYLLLLGYFKSKGGYQQEMLHEEIEHGHPATIGVDKHGEAAGEQYAGGVEGPVR